MRITFTEPKQAKHELSESELFDLINNVST